MCFILFICAENTRVIKHHWSEKIEMLKIEEVQQSGYITEFSISYVRFAVNFLTVYCGHYKIL